MVQLLSANTVPHFKTNTPVGAQMGANYLHNMGAWHENDIDNDNAI